MKAVVILGVAPLFLLICGLTTFLPRTTSTLASRPQGAIDPGLVGASEPASPALSSAAISAIFLGLPLQFEELDEFLPEWVKLEAAIIRGSSTVRDQLLKRYAAESDPAYKGALAGLLSADSSIHERLREDLQLPRGERWDLFHGLALYALVRTPPASPEAALSESNTERWKDLFTFARLAGYEVDARVEYKRTGEFVKALSCGASNAQLLRSWTLNQAISVVTSEDMRSRLIEVYESEWDWDWVPRLSREALSKTSEAFPDFAVRLAETYLTSSSWDRAEIGFDLLGDAPLPESSFIQLDRWARTSIKEYQVLREVLELVGNQRHPSADRLLLDLHAMTAPDSWERGCVLKAMIESGSPSFRSVAASGLSSPTKGNRIIALQLFSRLGGDESWKQIHEQAVNDVSAQVRYAALVYLMQREPKEEAAIQSARRASESDPDPRVRKLAQEMLTSNERPYLMSNWDWGSLSDKFNLGDED